MENLTVDVERIEQELQEIIRRFSKADIVLRELEEIQIEFENLAKTHKQLKDYVSEVEVFKQKSNDIIKQVQQASTDFEQRFEKLREANEVKTKEIYDELCKIQEELNTHRSLSDRLHQSLAEKQDLFRQFQLDLTEINNHLNSSTITTEKLNSEIIKTITNVDLNVSQLKSHVDGEYSKVNKEIRSHKKDIRIMRNAMIALLILWLCLGAFVLMK